jgi:hypothetical protein
MEIVILLTNILLATALTLTAIKMSEDYANVRSES